MISGIANIISKYPLSTLQCLMGDYGHIISYQIRGHSCTMFFDGGLWGVGVFVHYTRLIGEAINSISVR